MEDGNPTPRDLSLVPYLSDSREIVLRHGSAIVLYDERSKQLTLADSPKGHAVQLADCPYCHRPLTTASPGLDSSEHASSPGVEHGFVSPEYFRMLAHSTPGSAESSRPPSPRRRIQPVNTSAERSPPRRFTGAEFLGSSPPPPASPNGISSSAFSQNYYKRFFVEERELGRGGKGVVMLVTHVLDGVPLGQYACKRVPVGDDHKWLEKVLLEVQLLQSLSHQNLVSYRHVWLEDCKISAFAPSVPCAFILQQYCNGGDLHQYVLNTLRPSISTPSIKDRLRRKSKAQIEPPQELRTPRHMPFEEIFSFFKDITSGLHHLHTNGYIHRDLKPSNCLLHRLGMRTRVLVSDFGEVQLANMVRKSSGATGTISYCAPEVLRQDAGGMFGNFSTKSDIFSLGMIVYFMCFGRLPYMNADGIDEDREDIDLLRKEIAEWAGFDDGQKIRPDLPEKLYRFLRRLLSINPDERPGTEEILQGIKSGTALDELANMGQGPTSPIFEDVRSRVSAAESQSPAPELQALRREPSFARPALASFRPRSCEEARSNSAFDSNPQSHTKGPVNDSSVVLRTRKVHLPSTAAAPHLPRSPSRLMPPPRPPNTALTSFRQAVNVPYLLLLGRSILFLAKIFSTLSPCAPYAANPWIGYPLLGLAALDFTIPSYTKHGMETTALLLLVHLLSVVLAHRRGFLCTATHTRKQELWSG